MIALHISSHSQEHDIATLSLMEDVFTIWKTVSAGHLLNNFVGFLAWNWSACVMNRKMNSSETLCLQQILPSILKLSLGLGCTMTLLLHGFSPNGVTPREPDSRIGHEMNLRSCIRFAGIVSTYSIVKLVSYL